MAMHPLCVQRPPMLGGCVPASQGQVTQEGTLGQQVF